MRRSHLVVVLLLSQIGQGCDYTFSDLDLFANSKDGFEETLRVEIETDDNESSLPCRVVLRPDETTRDVLWQADFEQDFCDRKAEETKNVLKAKGWVCGRAQLDPEQAGPFNVRAAWNCVRRQQFASDETRKWPPIPEVRPQYRQGIDDYFTDSTLKSAVRRDLSSTIQKMAGQSTISAVTQGDLDGNGLSDAVVVLTNRTDQGLENHVVMAYLGDGESYNLTDIQVTPGDQLGTSDEVVVEINEGLIKLSVCCDRDVRPIFLAFRDRELVFSQ